MKTLKLTLKLPAAYLEFDDIVSRFAGYKIHGNW